MDRLGRPYSKDEAWEFVMGGAAGDARRNQLAADLDDTRTWVDPNGYRLSDRLWRARQADRAAIDNLLRQSLASGEDPLQTAKKLEDYLTPGGLKSLTKRPRSGLGNYAARRLARTETTRAFGQATIEAARRNPFTRAVRWFTSAVYQPTDDDGVCAEHARKSSRGLGRGEYFPDEVPRYPGHPNCRCYLSPVTVEDDAEIVAALRAELGIG